MTESVLFEQLGGAPGIARLVDDFYDRMEQPCYAALRDLHAPDLAMTRAVLKLYLAEWMGGPAEYSAAYGHPRLRQRHMHIRIGETERDDWMRCMSEAMAHNVPDEAARTRLTQNLVKLADWMRNQPGNPHDAGQAYGAGTETSVAQAGHVANSTVENPTNCPCSSVRD
ncbi:group II truncated hemoglobin [Acidocella sp.]|uniref:group II truncated hemoglobin n=1 Tax=Acidocella sp. TaxID=50710 RepID=UPI003D04CF5F